MTSPDSQPMYLEREYLPIRAKILEIAAALDRIQRAAKQQTDDSRWDQLQAGIRLLLEEEGERAEQVQLLFSRGYDEQWRETFGFATCD
ncbi:MAG: hypothetical protein GXP24_06300 [Planctomycetes bacterium]|nr:hypothetical protein [Planctomycetota bacterium]